MTEPPRSDGPQDDRAGQDRPGPWPWGPPAQPAGGFQHLAQPPADPPQYGQSPYAQSSYGPNSYGQPPYGGPQQYGQPFHGHPGYGQPGHEQPAHARQPAGSSPRGLVLGLGLLVLVALVVVGVVLALTTGRTVLARSAVEEDVAEQFEQREGVAVDLDCAEEMTVEEGAVYECSGVTSDDEEVTLRIEITDADGGRYTWSEP
jgi:uncharacterized protein DUF4333